MGTSTASHTVVVAPLRVSHLNRETLDQPVPTYQFTCRDCGIDHLADLPHDCDDKAAAAAPCSGCCGSNLQRSWSAPKVVYPEGDDAYSVNVDGYKRELTRDDAFAGEVEHKTISTPS